MTWCTLEIIYKKNSSQSSVTILLDTVQCSLFIPLYNAQLTINCRGINIQKTYLKRFLYILLIFLKFYHTNFF